MKERRLVWSLLPKPVERAIDVERRQLRAGCARGRHGAEAFVSARLGEDRRHEYGSVPAGTDFGKILARR